MAYRNNKWGGYNPQQNEKKQQLQEVVEITAHQKKLAFSVFYNTVEALEEYIEKIDYPGFKKQIFDKSINSPNRSPEDLADDFLSQLHCFKAMVNKKPEFLRDEIKKSFYKWINAARINVENCPENLKYYLFTINEILDGKGENFIEQMKKKIDDGKRTDPRDVLEVFRSYHVPINENKEQGRLLEGKTHKDIKVESSYDDADDEKGKEAFGKIYQEIVHKEGNFNFFPQVASSSGGGFPTNLNEIVQDVIQNPQNWRIDEIITGYSNVGKNKEEMTLIHRNARLEDYNQWTGELNFNNNPIYKKESFSNEEWTQIENALLHTTTSTNQTVRWDLVNNIKQQINEFKIEKMLVPNENNDYDEEAWIIHNSAERKSDKNGSLVFDPNKMFKVKDLTEAEQKELGMQNSDQVHQTQTQSDNNRKGDGKGPFGGWGNSILFGSFSVISLIGLAFTKK